MFGGREAVEGIQKASLFFSLVLGWAYRPPPPAQVRMAPLLRNVLEGNL